MHYRENSFALIDPPDWLSTLPPFCTALVSERRKKASLSSDVLWRRTPGCRIVSFLHVPILPGE